MFDTGYKINYEVWTVSYTHLDVYKRQLQGKLLRSTNMETGRGKEEIDLTAFASGMYLIRVRAEGLPDVTKRVVVNSNY